MINSQGNPEYMFPSILSLIFLVPLLLLSLIVPVFLFGKIHSSYVWHSTRILLGFLVDSIIFICPEDS